MTSYHRTLKNGLDRFLCSHGKKLASWLTSAHTQVRKARQAGLNGVGAFRSLRGRAGPPVLSAAVSESASPESLPSVPSELVMAAFAALNASPAQALQMDKGGGVSAAALRAVQLTQHVPFVRMFHRQF